MSQCDGCVTSEKLKNRERDSAIEKAKQYAKEKKIEIAVYQEAGEWKFINAFLAAELHYPVAFIVSQYNAE